MSAGSRRGLVALLVAIGAVLAAAPVYAATVADRAAAYLERAQNRDGGLGGMPGGASSPSATAWAAIGLAAAGRDPGEIRRRGGASLAQAVVASAAEARQTGDVQRTILALRAAGVRVPAELVERLLAARRPDGSFEGQSTLTSFGLLALRAAGRPARSRMVRRAAHFVAAQQNRDGGFGFGRRGGRSGIDDTAAAVQALRAARRPARSRVVRRAVAFLQRRQQPDGGFPLVPGAPSNAQSTAWAVQALVAAGRDPDDVRRRGSRSPIAYLGSLQASDGSIRYSRTSAQTPVWVTSQALAALARRPLPIVG